MFIQKGYLKFFYALSAIFIFGLLFSGCAKKMPPPALEEARAAYQTARANPAVIQHAPLELEKAGEALNKGEQLFEEKADSVEIEHQAYLAKQHSAIALEISDRKLAEEAIQRAGEMRNKILAQARGAEADYARQQALAQKAETTTAQERAAKLEAELAELQAVKADRGMVMTMGEVVFDVDKADLKPGGVRTVQKLASFLQEYPERNVMIEGFTDSTGAADYNQGLSERRASAVQTSLIGMGIEPARVQTRGYGEDFPVASNETAAGRQLNRRVEVIISNGEGKIQERSN